MNEFEPVSSEVQWEGSFLRAGTERFRYPDGTVVNRDKVWHQGAVGILAIDDGSVWLTRQPREVVGVRASLEIPAGKLDVPGELAVDTARRELGEEIGKQAESWLEVLSFYTSPGFSDERVWLFLATGLSDSGPGTPDEDERIEVVRWPLDRLDQAISETDDGKTLVALLWLKGRRPQE